MRNITIQECFESLKIKSSIDNKSISEREANELNDYIKNNNLDMDNIIWGRDTVIFINYVGYIKLSTVTIEIIPKVNINNSVEEGRKVLLNMLKKSGIININYSEINNVNLYKMSLNEVFAYLFVYKLKKEISKGLYYEYIYVNENIATLKGKLVMQKHIKNISSATPKAFCKYEEFSIDNKLNRTLLYAIKKLLRQINNIETIKILRHIQSYFTDVKEENISNLELNNYKFNRLNSRFEESFILAKMLLGGDSSIGDKGKDKSFSILFRMDEVFEKYIANILLSNLEEMVVHTQHSKYKLLASENSNRGIFQLRPDVVIEIDGKETIIIDTKWKRISNKYNRHGVKRDDLYQMYAYITRYQYVKNVILLYPYNSNVYFREDSYCESWSLEDNKEKKIKVYAVDLKSEEATIDNLKLIIQNLL